jgi:ATP-binding cassette subfamily F protein uup
VQGRFRHVVGYLRDFLFRPEQARTPLRALSGGERNRLLLARLFRRSSNVMVLDEPTNDLDTETLELLEELLSNYTGTLLLVSHDRAFLNNVVTATLAFTDDVEIKEYAGGYDDYRRQRDESDEENAVASRPVKKPNPQRPPQPQPATGRARLSYHDRQDLESLPQQIETLETEQARLHEEMTAADFFKQDAEAITAAHARLKRLESELSAAYARWEELESRG